MNDYRIRDLEILSPEFKRWMYFFHDFTPSDLIKMDSLLLVYYVDCFEQLHKRSAFLEKIKKGAS